MACLIQFMHGSDTDSVVEGNMRFMPLWLMTMEMCFKAKHATKDVEVAKHNSCSFSVFPFFLGKSLSWNDAWVASVHSSSITHYLAWIIVTEDCHCTMPFEGLPLVYTPHHIIHNIHKSSPLQSQILKQHMLLLIIMWCILLPWILIWFIS